MVDGNAKQGGKKKILPYLFILPFALLYLAFILFPLVGIIIKSFTNNNVAALEIFTPSILLETQFTLDNYLRLFTQPWSVKVLFSTLYIAFVSVSIAFIIGTPIAYAITKPDFKRRGIARWFLTLPIYLPIVVSSFALIWFFGPMGVLNSVIKSIFGFTVQLSYTYGAVIFGTVSIIVPTYVRTVATSFENIPAEVFEASMSLGANEIYTFFRIYLPISSQMIFAGLVLIFSMTIGMMEVAFIVGGGGIKVMYMPIEIFQKTLSYNPHIPFASAMATFLLVVSLGGQFLTMLFLGREKR